MSQQPQYILRIKAENFKKLRLVDFRPNRFGITKITGANASGKTSALEAVRYALADRKTLPANLIRQGERNGRIGVETTDNLVSRRLDEQGGAVQVERKDSNTLLKNPEEWCGTIAGPLSFDPLEFMRIKPEEQFDVLKKIVPLEQDIEELERQNEEDADTIKDKRAELKRMTAQRDGVSYDTTLPAEPIDIEALQAEGRAIAEHNREIEQQERERQNQRRERDALIQEMPQLQEKIKRLREELNQLEQQLEADSNELKIRNEEINAWKPLPALKDARAIDERIRTAAETNARISTNNERRELRERLDEEVNSLENEVSSLKGLVRDRKTQIAATLEHAKFPIPGLSFEIQEQNTAGVARKLGPKKIVTYNGIPLSDASTAEQIRVSAAIGMAGQPDLRCMLIHEGSLLDDDGLAILEKMAHEHEWQILMEIVDTSGKVGVYLEDGEVKAVNPELELEPATAKPAKRSSKKRQSKLTYGDESIG